MLTDKIDDPFERLAMIFDNSKGVSQSCDSLVKTTKFSTKYSPLGFVSKCVGYSDRKLHFYSTTLEMLGFSGKQQRQKRYCTENGCRFIDTMFGLIDYHLPSFHGYKMEDLGSKVRQIRDDVRKKPSLSDRLKSSVFSFNITLGRKNNPEDIMPIDICTFCGERLSDKRRSTKIDHERTKHHKEFRKIRNRDIRDGSIYIVIISGCCTN